MGAPEFDQDSRSRTLAGIDDAFKEGLRDFGENINTRFEGNEIYDFAIEEIRQFDWNNPDLELAKTVAHQITSKAAKKGIEVGSQLISKALLTWAAGLGMAGQVPLAVVTGGVGIALDWGLEALINMVWPKQDERYEPGDYIVINEGTKDPSNFRGWRRRLGKTRTGVDFGVVTESSHNNDGYVSAVNVTTGTQVNLRVQDIAKVPAEQVAELEATSPALANISRVIKELATPEEDRGEYNPGHKTTVGDKIKFQGDLYTIVKAPYLSGEKVRTIDITNEEDGQRVAVPVGDDRLEDVWSRSSQVHMPAGDQSFSQQTGLNAGELVWFATHHKDKGGEDDLEELGCIWAVKGTTVLVSSAYDGQRYSILAKNLATDDISADRNGFMAWKAAVVEGAERDSKEKCPGRRGFHEMCFRKSERPKPKAVTWFDPFQAAQEGGLETVQYSYNTTGEAEAKDAQWEFHGGKPDYADFQYGDETAEEAPAKGDGNTMMYIILAGGVVLAFMFSKQ